MVHSLPPLLLQNESLTTFGSIYKSAGYVTILSFDTFLTSVHVVLCVSQTPSASSACSFPVNSHRKVARLLFLTSIMSP